MRLPPQLIVATAAVALLSGCTGGGPPGGGRMPPGVGPATANPSAVVSAEIAFARLARDKGQWTAFRETAAKEAEMFVPQRVLAQTWLKGKADPAKSVSWAPMAVYMSCDGSAGATTGWFKTPEGKDGYFNTIWFRQPNGSYKWVVDHGAELPAPLPPMEFISTRIASCKGKAPAALSAPEQGVDMKVGYARDQSLSWTTRVWPDGKFHMVIAVWNGTEMEPVITDAPQ